jgi:hypothetical protein
MTQSRLDPKEKQMLRAAMVHFEGRTHDTNAVMRAAGRIWQRDPKPRPITLRDIRHELRRSA